MDDRQILLTEYQVWQDDHNSSIQSYWIIVGIFVGVSSALLGGILAGILQSENSLNIFISNENNNIYLVSRILISVFSVGIIIVLGLLWSWLYRENYLSQRGYERMREIELELGMWKSWRIHAIDTWHDLHITNYDKQWDNRSIDERWAQLRDRLIKGMSSKYIEKLEANKDMLIDWCNTTSKISPRRWFQRQSSRLHFPIIFGTLMFLWFLLAISTWVLPLVFDC
jgi:hypothetical protein